MDVVGECSFIYWWSDVVVRYLMDFLSDDVVGLFKIGDVLFILGIFLVVIIFVVCLVLWSLFE